MEETPAFENDDGALPSSLIAVHKLSRPDPLHDFQLLRDVAIINERTERELGRRFTGAAEAPAKRKPRLAHLARYETCEHDTHPIHEENTVNATQLIAAVAISTGVLSANAGDLTKAALSERSLGTSSSEQRRERLGSEYEKMTSFFEFKKKLLKDGWTPVPNPDCMQVVAGGDGNYFCGKDEIDYSSCRMCEVIPETFRSTADGYSLMRYKKNGVILGVSVYGDPQAIDQPELYDLAVTGWHYDGSVNVILLEDIEEPEANR